MKQNIVSFETPHLIPDLDLRAPEVQDILGRPPKTILRMGISVISAVVVALFAGCWIIKYPDILPAPVIVTTENLPAGVMAMTTGKIDAVAVEEKQVVKEGDLLAIISNPANYEDVMMLKRMLEEVDTQVVKTHGPPSLQTNRSSSLQLGDLQSAYIAFDNALNDYHHFVEADYHNRKIKVVQKQISTQKELLYKTINQLYISKNQLEAAQNLFEIDSTLYSKGAISLVDYQSARNIFLQQQSSFESSKMNVDNQQMSLLQSEQSVFDLEQQRVDEAQRLMSALTSAIERLAAQILQWEQNYLLVAPCDGKVTFTKYWQKNQNVKAGEVLVTVVPDDQIRVIGKILLPPHGAGKVQVGQAVNVKLDNYPYMEYGMLKASIRSISLVPVQHPDGTRVYSLEVAFPAPLVTTSRKQLSFTHEMTGTAEIITEDLRLLDRFWKPVKSLFVR